VIEGGFRDFVAFKAPGFSEGEFDVGVEAFHDAAGDLLLRLEPVEEELAVLAEGADEFLDGLES